MSANDLMLVIACVLGLIAVGLLGYAVGRDRTLRELGLDPDKDLP